MREPAWLKCPECGSEDRYMILAESHPMGDGMVQIYCAKCHASWPVIQAHQPQMSDHVAKQLGVPVPDPGIDIDLDLGDEE